MALPPYIIDFEGIEGSGKSTQARLLKNELNQRGYKTFLFKEPSGTILGKRIRKLLISNQDSPSPIAELFLFLAARAQLWRKIKEISHSANKLIIIILEGSVPATYAFQYKARGIGKAIPDKIKKFLDKLSTLNQKISKIILLDASPKISLKRKKRRDRFERESIIFHDKVRKGYLLQAKNNKNWLIFKANDSVKSLKKKILNAIVKLLND